jgi:hypothetical protein
MVAAIEAVLPAVRNCNAADYSRRKSAECAIIATKAASFAAHLVANCTILPFRTGSPTDVQADSRDPVIVGDCYRFNYPPVRSCT